MAIEVGSIVEGTVSGITNFGAFVELPEGKVGLIHISEVADEYVSDVKDFLKEKDKVKVKVLNIDDKGKIGLSIKRLQDLSSGAVVMVMLSQLSIAIQVSVHRLVATVISAVALQDL